MQDLSGDAIATLSQREQDVLRLLAEGMTTKEIAEKLVISPKTTSIHLWRIYQKLNVNNAVSAVRCAIKAGFVEP
jgi:RNA polymerase sigma factor (sigma-70 family)